MKKLEMNKNRGKIMNKTKIFAIIMLIFSFSFLFVGCGDENLPNAKVTRDSEMTGGSLSFEYNQESGHIYVGGQDEIVQFYDSNITKGWQEEGNRIGLVFYAPKKLSDYETGTLSFQGETFSGGGFFRRVNGEKIGEVIIYPLISEEDKEIEIKITWQEGIKEQVYKLIIKKGTTFMQKPQN